MASSSGIARLPECRGGETDAIVLAMALPRLVHSAGGRVYLVDADGVTWRIHDVGFGPPHAPPGHRHIYPIESPRANYLHFVNADGVDGAHQFEPGVSHRLTVESCTRQLAGSGYVGRRGRDRGATRPT